MKKYNENEAINREEIIIGIINVFLHVIMLVIIKISLIVLIVGGADMLIITNINHQNVILGEMDIKPLNIIIFRVWVLLYKSLARRNRAEEVNPWAIIIIIAPIKPKELNVIKAINESPI